MFRTGLEGRETLVRGGIWALRLYCGETGSSDVPSVMPVVRPVYNSVLLGPSEPYVHRAILKCRKMLFDARWSAIGLSEAAWADGLC